MPTIPSTDDKLLATKTPSGLAKLLCGISYDEMGKIIYPAAKYREFTIKKKNGNERQIAAPQRKLLIIQKRLAKFMQKVAKIKPSAHGFISGRSIVTNAKRHCSKEKTFVFNIDLKDFFPSITFARVRGVFMCPPFSYPFSVATVLAHTCCFRGLLPQGAPTSPIISNLVCRGLDGDLQKLAQECRATYTRYADDITFSFSAKKLEDLSDRIVKLAGTAYSVGESLEQIVTNHAFAINPDKVRLHSKNGRMEVTGLTVNQLPNVRRSFVHQVRGMLHAWERYGIEAADQEFQTKKSYTRQLRSKQRPRFDRVLWGKLLFIKMVKGDLDPVYVRLARRYNAVAARDQGLMKKPPRYLPKHNLVIDLNELEQAVYVVRGVDEARGLANQGTAFFLEGIGVVTCEHVISHPNTDFNEKKFVYFGQAGYGVIQLEAPNETPICNLEVVFLDRFADLAVLRPIAGHSVSPLFLRDSEQLPEKEEEVTVVGYPDHKPTKTLACDKGPVITPYKKFRLDHFHIKPLIQMGNSGGPVIDGDLRVVGMAKEGANQSGGENSVLSINEIKRLFENFKTSG